MKKKIAILEFETHSNLLLQWNSLLYDSELFEVEFILSSAIHQQVKNEISNCIILDIISINSFDFSKYNLIIINTLHRNFDLFSSIFKNNKILLIVHNLNFYFKTNQPNFLKLFFLYDWKMKYYLLKLMIKERIYQQKKIIFNSTFFGYLGNSNQKITNLHSIPLHFNLFDNFIEKKEILICIPGSVEQKRKDYLSAIELLKKINPISKLHFVFLGKVKENKLRIQLENISITNKKNLRISYFTSRVNQEDFERFMMDLDFVFCPIHPKTDFYLQEEFYGKTKVSGAEFDCITYGKPIILPDFYFLNWNKIGYGKLEDLEIFFNNLTFEISYEYQIKTEKFIQMYQRKSTQQRLENILEQMCN